MRYNFLFHNTETHIIIIIIIVISIFYYCH
jgi:hypothetical protein